jgi:hypothetical protein
MKRVIQMTKNIHPVERVVRVVGGLVLASMAFVGPSNPWFLLGLVPVATGLVGWCPPYALFGFSTCAKK